MTRPFPRVRGLVTAAVLAAVTGLTVVGPGTAPAAAAVCADAGGVSVVVDFRELGGGLATGCDADGGGKSAATLFADAGFALEYVQRQPGFVCRVNGAPAADVLRVDPAGQRLLGPVLVQRHVRVLVVLQPRGRLADRPRGRLRRVRLAGPDPRSARRRRPVPRRVPDAVAQPHSEPDAPGPPRPPRRAAAPPSRRRSHRPSRRPRRPPRRPRRVAPGAPAARRRPRPRPVRRPRPTTGTRPTRRTDPTPSDPSASTSSA